MTHPTPETAAVAAVRPQTLTSVAAHIDARAVAILRPESQTFAEWQAIAGLLRLVAAKEQPAETHGADRGAKARVRALHQQYRFAGDDTTDYCAHCNQISGGWIPWPCPTIRALDAEWPAVVEQPDTQTREARLVELRVHYRVQLRDSADTDWKASEPRVDYEDRERAEASVVRSRELFPRREYRVVTRTTTITEQP